MGNRRPKSEQLDKRFSRRRGMTLVEILMAMALMSIVLGIVLLVSNSSFRIAANVQTLIQIDEQVNNIHSSIRSIVSRSWTGFTLVDYDEGESLMEWKSSEIELRTFVPLLGLGDPWPDGLKVVESRIFFDEESRRILHSFDVSEDSQTTRVLAENISDFYFHFMKEEDNEDSNNGESTSNTQHLFYKAVVDVNGITRDVRGAVKFY